MGEKKYLYIFQLNKTVKCYNGRMVPRPYFVKNIRKYSVKDELLEHLVVKRKNTRNSILANINYTSAREVSHLEQRAVTRGLELSVLKLKLVTNLFDLKQKLSPPPHSDCIVPMFI